MTPRAADAADHAVIERVVAGDLVEVTLRGELQIVQMIGIGTPRPRAQCGGVAAKKVLRHLVEGSEIVVLQRDDAQPSRDRRGRLLRYISLRGRDLGKVQAGRGWGEVADEPFDRANAYRSAASSARERRAGVWHYCGGDFHQPI
jgi:endonuclease YncB( thermonuclease family)